MRGRGAPKAHRPERNAVSAFLWAAVEAEPRPRGREPRARKAAPMSCECMNETTPSRFDFDDMGMRRRISALVRAALEASWAAGELPEFEVPEFLGVERASDPAKGDWTSTVRPEERQGGPSFAPRYRRRPSRPPAAGRGGPVRRGRRSRFFEFPSRAVGRDRGLWPSPRRRGLLRAEAMKGAGVASTWSS